MTNALKTSLNLERNAIQNALKNYKGIKLGNFFFFKLQAKDVSDYAIGRVKLTVLSTDDEGNSEVKELDFVSEEDSASDNIREQVREFEYLTNMASNYGVVYDGKGVDDELLMTVSFFPDNSTEVGYIRVDTKKENLVLLPNKDVITNAMLLEMCTLVNLVSTLVDKPPSFEESYMCSLLNAVEETQEHDDMMSDIAAKFSTLLYWAHLTIAPVIVMSKKKQKQREASAREVFKTASSSSKISKPEVADDIREGTSRGLFEITGYLLEQSHIERLLADEVFHDVSTLITMQSLEKLTSKDGTYFLDNYLSGEEGKGVAKEWERIWKKNCKKNKRYVQFTYIPKQYEYCDLKQKEEEGELHQNLVNIPLELFLTSTRFLL